MEVSDDSHEMSAPFVSSVMESTTDVGAALSPCATIIGIVPISKNIKINSELISLNNEVKEKMNNSSVLNEDFLKKSNSTNFINHGALRRWSGIFTSKYRFYYDGGYLFSYVCYRS